MQCAKSKVPCVKCPELCEPRSLVRVYRAALGMDDYKKDDYDR